MTEFSPDWSLADARRESLREHMAMVTGLARENERLRDVLGRIASGVIPDESGMLRDLTVDDCRRLAGEATKGD